MKKNFLCLLLVLSILAGMVPTIALPVFADGDFEIGDGVLTKFTGAGGDVEIPNNVTTIGMQGSTAQF